jgi:hypothetical protein
MKDRVQEQALEAVRHSRPQDYDGHTEFDRMTPGQRLAWLDEATLLVVSHKKTALRSPTTEKIFIPSRRF